MFGVLSGVCVAGLWIVGEGALRPTRGPTKIRESFPRAVGLGLPPLPHPRVTPPGGEPCALLPARPASKSSTALLPHGGSLALGGLRP